MSGRSPLSGPLGLIIGFSLWGLSFVLLYAAHGYSCAAGLDGTRWLLAGVWLLSLGAGAALILAFLRRRKRGDRRFLPRLGLALAIAAFGAMLWTGLPVTLLGTC